MPGRRVSVEPGISRFRVRFAPGNDGNDVKIPCSHCLRLVVLEPHPRSKLEVQTYRCDRCNHDETFMVSAK
jgi:hypothetical protein